MCFTVCGHESSVSPRHDIILRSAVEPTSLLRGGIRRHLLRLAGGFCRRINCSYKRLLQESDQQSSSSSSSSSHHILFSAHSLPLSVCLDVTGLPTHGPLLCISLLFHSLPPHLWIENPSWPSAGLGQNRKWKQTAISGGSCMPPCCRRAEGWRCCEHSGRSESQHRKRFNS